MLNRIKQASEEKGLLLNTNMTKKTKITVVNRDKYTIAENKIEVVNQFDYLGSIIKNKGENTTQILRRRLAMARSTVQSMSQIWFAYFVLWAMTKNDRKRVDAFELS